jgi:hypothetical protein
MSRCAACLARLRLERVPLPLTQIRRRRRPPAPAPLADLAVQWAHARVVGPRADVRRVPRAAGRVRGLRTRPGRGRTCAPDDEPERRARRARRRVQLGAAARAPA